MCFSERVTCGTKDLTRMMLVKYLGSAIMTRQEGIASSLMNVDFLSKNTKKSWFFERQKIGGSSVSMLLVPSPQFWKLGDFNRDTKQLTAPEPMCEIFISMYWTERACEASKSKDEIFVSMYRTAGDWKVWVWQFLHKLNVEDGNRTDEGASE